MIPNRIELIVHGSRYDEAVASVDLYPGMLGIDNADGTVGPHNIAGGRGAFSVVLEDALLGKDITQKIASGMVAPLRRPVPGDVLLMLLKNGQNVAKRAKLMSAGDGTLIAAVQSNNVLYQIIAPSANVTNKSTEETFSNGTYTIPSNFLKAGDVIHLRGKVVVSGRNSTNTHDVKVKIGSTVLFDSGALALDATEYVEWDIYLIVRSIGASGSISGSGMTSSVANATSATTSYTLAATAVDTTASQAITVTVTASAASTGNVAALQEFEVDEEHSMGFSSSFQAEEAVNNSGGTGTSGFSSAAFIRVMIRN